MTTYKIEGMTCGGCSSSVERALTRAFPGSKISVDLEGGTASITGEVEESAVQTAIDDAGFDYKGVVG